jgi:hypothetical protein
MDFQELTKHFIKKGIIKVRCPTLTAFLVIAVALPSKTLVFNPRSSSVFGDCRSVTENGRTVSV